MDVRSHLYRKHGKKEVQQGSDSEDMDTTEYLGNTTIEDDETEVDTQQDTIERQQQAALFILKAREERMLT